MKQRKKLPYLALFIDDWLASAKVRKCSEITRGVYIDLLCIMHKEKRRGSYALHDQELKPNNTRSKTQLALSKSSEMQRLPYFAEFLVKRTGSSKTVIVKALQELYQREILVVEGDTLIQPRMYRDSGFRLLSDPEENAAQEATETPDGATEKPMADKGGDAASEDKGKGGLKSDEKSAEKSTPKSRARASRERAHIHYESGSENNNIGNNIDNDIDSIAEKREKNPPTPQKKPSVADNPPSLEEVQAYFDERAQQGRPFIYVTPDGFYDACCQSGWTLKDGKPIRDWKARVRTFESFRKEHGDKPVAKGGGQTATPLAPKAGDPVAVTSQKRGRYNKKW